MRADGIALTPPEGSMAQILGHGTGMKKRRFAGAGHTEEVRVRPKQDVRYFYKIYFLWNGKRRSELEKSREQYVSREEKPTGRKLCLPNT